MPNFSLGLSLQQNWGGVHTLSPRALPLLLPSTSLRATARDSQPEVGLRAVRPLAPAAVPGGSSPDTRELHPHRSSSLCYKEDMAYLHPDWMGSLEAAQ